MDGSARVSRHPANLEASISVRGVSVTYPNGAHALADASFDLGPGTICGLVGVNGYRAPLYLRRGLGALRRLDAGDCRRD